MLQCYCCKGGRYTLVQSVSVPIYFLSLFKVPVSIARKIEKLIRDFLWEECEEGKGVHLVRWESVSLSRAKGGLVIGNIVARNSALLGKWLWRFPLESELLWCSVIKSKYGIQSNGRDSKVVNRGNCCSPWKSISRLYPLVSNCLSFKVGNGENVRFWEDVWLGDISFVRSFPLLYRLAHSPNVSIALVACSSMTPISWNFDLIRNLNDREAGELASLLVVLEGVSLSSSSDSRVWNLVFSGVFSCKSFVEKFNV
ncbi:hypothetical protein CsSME_00049909 [Camellia sinensis var. sinensis]